MKRIVSGPGDTYNTRGCKSLIALRASHAVDRVSTVEEKDAETSSGLAHADPGYMLRVYAVDDSSELTLADLWAKLWSGRWWIIAITLGLGFAAAAFSYTQEPVYRASVTLAPVVEDRSSLGIASLAGQLTGIPDLSGLSLGGGDTTDEAIATLLSRTFTVDFIQQNALMPVLFADIWDAQSQTWNVETPAETPTTWAAYERFRSIRNVTQDFETGMITLTVDWTDPQLAATWANGLVGGINDSLRGQAIRQSNDSINYLKNVLDDTRELELRTAIFGLIEVEMKKSMVATVKDQYAFKMIDPAVPPEKRYSPNRFLYLSIGLAVGLIIGVVVALARNSFRISV